MCYVVLEVQALHSSRKKGGRQLRPHDMVVGEFSFIGALAPENLPKLSVNSVGLLSQNLSF